MNRQVITGYLDPAPALALAGVLGVVAPDFDAGEPLPLLWHGVYLLPHPTQAQLGVDGHPLDGVPSPPAPGLRRMFASGSVSSVRALHLGRPARRTTELVGTTTRDGRTGTLIFASVRSTIEQDDEVAVIDDQTLVYRAASTAPSATPTAVDRPLVDTGSSTRVVELDPVLLFRFSALTYNAHRIHYDRDYATGVEGYPGLLVHGPMQALLMIELARAQADAPIERFEYRLSSPLFDGQAARVSATPGEGGITTAVHGAAGQLTASGLAVPQ
jgi:3-methylfumaryl-CoA hydratase